MTCTYDASDGRAGGSTVIFFFQAEDGIRDTSVTGVQTCALPISSPGPRRSRSARSHTILTSLSCTRSCTTRRLVAVQRWPDRKSTRLNSSHRCISYAVFCLKKKKKKYQSQSYGYTRTQLACCCIR